MQDIERTAAVGAGRTPGAGGRRVRNCRCGRRPGRRCGARLSRRQDRQERAEQPVQRAQPGAILPAVRGGGASNRLRQFRPALRPRLQAAPARSARLHGHQFADHGRGLAGAGRLHAGASAEHDHGAAAGARPLLSRLPDHRRPHRPPAPGCRAVARHVLQHLLSLPRQAMDAARDPLRASAPAGNPRSTKLCSTRPCSSPSRPTRSCSAAATSMRRCRSPIPISSACSNRS